MNTMVLNLFCILQNFCVTFNYDTSCCQSSLAVLKKGQNVKFKINTNCEVRMYYKCFVPLVEVRDLYSYIVKVFGFLMGKTKTLPSCFASIGILKCVPGCVLHE